MARYGLIDGYLDTMRTEIRWRRDLDDVVSEMEDHLYSTVEGLLASGAEPQAAQRATLDRFGEPDVLKAVYASTPTGGIAVPTTFTRRAGTFALISAGFWLATAGLYVFGRDSSDGEVAAYMIFSAGILIAGVFLLLAMFGMGKRLGGLGVLGVSGLVITLVGVAFSVLAWAIPFWMGLQGIGLLLFGIAVLRSDLAPRWSTLLASAGFILGVIAFFALTELEVGTPDSYGDYPVAWGASLVTGTVIVSLGLIGWGVWLRSEEAVSTDNDTPAITA
jgi:hypothetical protein